VAEAAAERRYAASHPGGCARAGSAWLV